MPPGMEIFYLRRGSYFLPKVVINFPPFQISYPGYEKYGRKCAYPLSGAL